MILGIKEWFMDRSIKKMSEEEKQDMMEKMMDKFFEGVSQEEKQKMMEKMMDKFFGDMSKKEKQKLMEKMMPRMMSGLDVSGMMQKMMPTMMKAMMSSSEETGKGECPSVSLVETQSGFRPWEFCPCRKLCEGGFEKKTDSPPLNPSNDTSRT